PDAPIVYVDNDPFVVAHGRALLSIDDRIAVLGRDLCQVSDLSLIHISEPTRPISIAYAVFCLKKQKQCDQQG
ncbi:SAM-dependent methyltransferase, partial [Nocardia nova]|uniref:SAM-dependent methyltransferase n=1 Tax=Nocardia nova TaxID=37330 RepID=UPI000D3FFB08